MTRIVSEHQAQEWLDHPVSLNLKQVLKHRRDRLVLELLSGRPADPIRQGQAVALQWVLQLLDRPPAALMEELHKLSQQDRPVQQNPQPNQQEYKQ